MEGLLKTHDQIVHIPHDQRPSSGAPQPKARPRSMAAGCRWRTTRNFATQQQAVRMRCFGARAHLPDPLTAEAHGAGREHLCDGRHAEIFKKGRLVTPGAAAAGTVLNIKPVLQIQGGQVDAYAKAGIAPGDRKDAGRALRDLTGRFEGMPCTWGWRGRREGPRK